MHKTTRRGFLSTTAAGGLTLQAADGLRAAAATDSGWREQFRSPARKMRPLTFYWPTQLEPEAVASDFAALNKLGLGGVILEVGRVPGQPPYMSEEFCRKFRMVVDEAIKQDMRVWLYDEQGYPSGSAGGLTLKNHPEYEVTGLEYHAGNAEGGQPFELQLPAGSVVFAKAEDAARPGAFTDLNGAIAGGVLRWNAPAGKWRVHAFVKQVGDVLAKLDAGANGLVLPLPNLLDANAIREFISNTYEPYARWVGRYFGGKIEAIFTDEPCLHVAGFWDFKQKPEDHRPMMPWVDGFSEYFFARKGYDIVPLLPSLIAEGGPETSQVRCDYWKVVSDLICDSYFGQISEWCTRHGIAFTGHCLLEESLLMHVMFSGSFIRNLSRMRIPGIDLIGPRPAGNSTLEDTMTNIGGVWVGKLASSAAHTRGNSEAMSESFAASGPDMTLEKMIATVNWEFAAGITDIHPCSSHYRIDPGNAQQSFLSRPNQAEFAKDPSFLGTYIARIKSLLTGGVHIADVAMLVPETSIWANYVPAPVGLPYEEYRRANPAAVAVDNAFTGLATELLRNQIDFDFVDDEAFLLSEIASGSIKLGQESYRVLLLPDATTMRAGVAQKVAAFRRAGGLVVACGRLAEESAERGKNDAVNQAMAETFRGPGALHVSTKEEAPAAVRKLWAVDVSLAAPDRRIYYLHKRRDNRDIYFVVNMSADKAAPDVTFNRSKGSAMICDPRTGNITAARTAAGPGTRLSLAIDGLSAQFIIFG